MKRGYTVVLSLIFVCVVGFAVTIVRLTNWNLETMFRSNFENTFYLLTSLVDQNLRHQSELLRMETDALRAKGRRIGRNGTDLGRESLNGGLQGIWIFDGDLRSGVTEYDRIEDEIIDLYAERLKGMDAHTLVFIEDRPFILSNTATDSLDILVLAEAKESSVAGFARFLDSLVVSSDLRYFSILDERETPMIFSSAYENFLPLKGRGSHVLDTPDGKIYQIEDVKTGGTIAVAGFTMNSLHRIQNRNRLLLILVVLIFVVLEGVLLLSSLRFERFRMRKEEELHLLRETGALSSGFAHEFRNSLHTLALLARDVTGETRELLTGEITKMKSVMDSLRLMETGGMEKEEIRLSDLIDECMSMLTDRIKGSGTKVEKRIAVETPVFGNRPLLVSAFSNILKNSMEADAQNVTIRAEKRDGYLVVEFADDGRGIDQAVLSRVFEPFFSAKGQSGLGLYLVKRIVKAHEGEVRVRSEKGTTVEIRMRAQ